MSLDISAAELFEQPDLAKALLYHVVSGKVMSTDLSDGEKVNDSRVVTADLEGSNGVIHVIDTVLVTSNFTLQNVNKDEEIHKTGDVELLPYALIGIISIGGYSLVNRKGK